MVDQPETRSDEMGFMFQGVMARHRYTDLLKNVYLSKALFAYGTKDRRIGSLDPAEVNFLVSRGATVHGVSTGVSDYLDEEGTTHSCATDPEEYAGCPGRHGSMFVSRSPANQVIVDWIDR